MFEIRKKCAREPEYEQGKEKQEGACNSSEITSRKRERIRMGEHEGSAADPGVSIETIKEFASKPGWYHTIELRPGIRTAGVYDHEPYLSLYGFPASMSNWGVLDVGSSDGYFSFQFERRQAASILATDTQTYTAAMPIDPSPAHRAAYVEKYSSRVGAESKFRSVYEVLGVPFGHQFLAAKALLGSRAEFRTLSVYDLTSLNEKFDFVFCGDLIEHLKNPLCALENLASVTGRQCIIVLSSALPAPANRPLSTPGSVALKIINLLARAARLPPLDLQKHMEYHGNVSGGSFFHFSPEAFRQALLASGFSTAEIYSRFDLPNLRHGTSNRHVVYHCSVKES